MAITNRDIWDYIDYVKDNPNDTNKWIKLLVSKIAIPVLRSDDYYLDEERYSSAIAYAEANYYKLFPYQKFIYAFAFIRRKDNDLLAFSTIIVIMGRGNGKDGMMMPLMNFLQTPLNGIHNYHIDIVANSEKQAIDSFNVVHDMLEDNKAKFSKKFRWNMETITDKSTNSELRYNTSNAKTKDGKKTGAIFFNEYHAYETYSQITVFTSGLGKIRDPRKFIVTTFGYVRDGPLDNLVKTIKRILSTGENKQRYFPMYFCLDDDSEVGNEKAWIKANPSINYMPVLRDQIKLDYIEAIETGQPQLMSEFKLKRMNLLAAGTEQEVTSWKNIEATNREIPSDIFANDFVVGIDFSKLTDMASVSFVTKRDGTYYVIQKTFFNRQSKDFRRVKAPVEEWNDMRICKMQFFELVDDVEISGHLLTKFMSEMLSKGANIVGIAADSFRFSIIRVFIEKDLGFNVNDRKFLKLIRPSDIMKVTIMIDSLFNNHKIVVGDNPCFRWSVNNAVLIPKDRGNYEYGKQEQRSRKTDAFMSFVHAMTMADALSDEKPADLSAFKVYTY